MKTKLSNIDGFQNPEELIEVLQALISELSLDASDEEMQDVTVRIFEFLDKNLKCAALQKYAGDFFEGRALYRQAYECYKRVVDVDTDNGDAWLKFGVILYQLSHYDAAVIALERSAKLNPDCIDTYLALGKSYNKLESLDKAHQSFDKALEVDQNSLDALFQKAVLYQSCGQYDHAKELFYRILESYPDSIETYYQLVRMRYVDGNESDLIEKLQDKIEYADLEIEQKKLAHFSIANLYERSEQFDEAFEHYALGNDISDTVAYSDLEQYQKLIDDTIAGYSKETFELLKAAGNPTERPIFIVGMMRSGTTLVEQSLGQHSEIFPAGEVLKLSKTAQTLIDINSGAFHYPRDINLLSPEVIKSFGQDYLNFIDTLTPHAVRYVTDKLPFNFFHIGFIKVLFPNAKIIHCLRDPMDTCLSCYFQNFTNGPAFSRNLDTLGQFYCSYKKLMAHWDEILPEDIHNVVYEDFVQDPETQIKSILEYLNLGWDENCLNHHESKRSIKTASQWQVRQPIYQSSVKRWRKYEKHLDKLAQNLDVCLKY